MTSILFIFRQPPYAGTLARDALDMALANAVFNIDVAILFRGDGVWQLLADQQPSEGKSLLKSLTALPLYGVDHLYASAECLQARGISADALPLPVDVVGADRVDDLLNRFDQVSVW